MNTQIDLWYFIFGAAALQGVFLIFVLMFQKRGSRFSNGLLAFLILIITSVLTERFLTHIDFYRIFPHYLFLSYGLWYLWAPVFYFYIKSSLYENVKLSKTDLLHLIPFVIYIVANNEYIFASWSTKVNYIDDFVPKGEVTIYNLLIPALLRVQTIVYLVFTGILIYKYKILELNGSKETRKNQLVLLKAFFLAVSLLQVYDVFFLIINYIGKTGGHLLKNVRLLITVIINYSIAFAAIKYPERLFPQFKREIDRYKSSKLTEEEMERIESILQNITINEKLYLNNNIKLKDFADKLNVSQHSISQTLNLKLGYSFYDYINKFRIEKAKEILISGDTDKFTLLHVAYEAGFNSKSSFNRAFKKHTGITPSEFINSEINVSNN